jgi:hypothetical protein
MKIVWWLVLGVFAMGCAPRASTAGGSALVHPQFPYGVSYDDADAKSVLGDEWKLETYRRKRQRTQRAPIELERKEGYEATYLFDVDEDDKTDDKVRLPIPDLLFVNRRTNARLEVVTLLLDNVFARRELRVLLQNVVEGGTGTRSLFVGFGRSADGVQKRYASSLVESHEATLGGQPGLVATIEHADLDQLQLTPNARARRTRLFLMRAPFDYYARGSSDASGVTHLHQYKALLMVEYSNAPEDFDAQHPEFLRLMSKLHFIGDLRMLDYLQDELVACAKGKPSDASISLEISGQGRATLRSASGLALVCTTNLIKAYPFAATGKARIINKSYDFSKEAPDPAWLDQNEYAEATPAVVPVVPPAPAPEAAPVAPAPAAAPVTPVDATAPASVGVKGTP